MADYEQLEFDVRLESDRELQENVGLAVSFACKQMQQEIPKKIENRHEGYGVLAEAYAKLQASMKKVGEGFKHYALILTSAYIMHSFRYLRKSLCTAHTSIAADACQEKELTEQRKPSRNGSRTIQQAQARS